MVRFVGVFLFAAALLAQDKKNDWSEIVAQGVKNVKKLRALRGELPRAEFSIPDLARHLGKDPKKAADFVRDAVAYESYRGFMKGAAGALVSRRANSADRALLLAALLSECGISSKLVRGTLVPDKHPAPALPTRPNTALTDEAIAQAAKKAGVDPEKVKARLAAARAGEVKFLQNLWTRVNRDLQTVSAALQEAGVSLPQSAHPPASESFWWVRTADGDLLKPADAAETSAHDVADLPKEEFHQVVIRMKIKQDDNERLVLDVPLRSAELFGQVIKVGNVPGDGVEKLLKLNKADWKTIAAAMTSAQIFVPTVTAGTKTINGKPFDLTGDVIEIRNGAIQKKVKGAMGMLDDLPGGDKKESGRKELTANWLEVDLVSPGQPVLTLRRSIFSKGTTGVQRVLDLLAGRDILVLPGDLSSDFVLDLYLSVKLDQQEHLLSQMKDPKTIPSELRPSLNATLYRFALCRAAGLDQLRRERFKDDVPSRSRPTLVSYAYKFVDAKPMKSWSCIDILHNSVAASGAFAPAAGIFETALEHEIHTSPGRHLNTSVLLEKLLLANGSVRVVKGALPDDLKLSETARREIQAGLETSAYVVVPGSPASWYQIDLKTGVTLGYVEGGGGQDSAEYPMLAVNMLKQVLEWKSKVELLNSALECVMNAIDAADPNAELARCMALVLIQEAFGWAAGGILEGAGEAGGTASSALWGAFGSEGTGALLDEAIERATQR